MSHHLLRAENLGLHRFAIFTACSTVFLIFVGGLVTSTESGLAVPDWPLSYGMFFPPMVGGIFYEHGHRMVAAFVGLLTLTLTVWICIREKRAWVRRLSIAALVAVILQALLGGITVLYLLPTAVSMTHACLAQTFFCLTIALALFTSPGWKQGLPRLPESSAKPALAALCGVSALSIYLQLILGAWMRHTDSGLAIPDFPLAFGRIVPPFESGSIAIHFAHRLGALVVTVLVVWTFMRISRNHRTCRMLFRPAALMFVLVWIQLTLGGLTVLTAKAVVPTTVHVATGALVLGTSIVLALRAFAMSAAGESAWR